MIYKAVVQVLWLGHHQEARRSDPGPKPGAGGPTGRENGVPQPFLGFRCDDPEEVANALRTYAGKHVSLRFALADS